MTSIYCVCAKSYPPSDNLKWWQLHGLKLSISFTVIFLRSCCPFTFSIPLLSIGLGLLGGLLWLFHRFLRLFQNFLLPLLPFLVLLIIRFVFHLLLFLLNTEPAVSVGHDFVKVGESVRKREGGTERASARCKWSDNPGAFTEIDPIVCYSWSHNMCMSGQSRFRWLT